MIGDAVPIRFSRRIKRGASLSPIRVSPKRKIRRSAVKIRTSGINSSIFKENAKVGRKNKSKKQTLKLLKEASRNLKPCIISESSRKNMTKICDKKQKTRNSLKATQVNLSKNEVPLKNIELFDNSKNVIEKKNLKEIRRSLRLSKSSLKEKGKNKELSFSDLKPSKERGRPSLKKSSKQLTSSCSKSVLTPNSEKSLHTLKHSDRKKSARLSTVSPNQGTFVLRPASKSLSVTSVPGKATCTSRHLENRKSRRLSKEPNRLRVMNSEISLHTSSFHSLLETPHPEKDSVKRKSPRLLEPSPLRTLNKELSLSTPASLLIRNPDSTLNKSCKRVKPLSSKSHCRKKNRPKVYNKDDCTIFHENQKQKVGRLQKTSENFKKPLSNETENLPLDTLTTPAFKPPRGRSLPKNYLSESDSKASKRKINTSASKIQVVSEKLQDAKKRKKSAGDNVCVDNSTSPSKNRSMKNRKCPVKTNHTEKLKNNQNSRNYLMPVTNIQGKLDFLTADLHVKQFRGRVKSVPCIREILLGDNVCVDNSTSPSKNRSMKKRKCPFKTNHTEKLKNNQNNRDYLMPVTNIQGKLDFLTADLHVKQFRGRVKSVHCIREIDCLSTFKKRKEKHIELYKKKSQRKLISMPCENKICCLSVGERKEKSTGNLKRKIASSQKPYLVSLNVLSSNTSTEKTIGNKKSPVKYNIYETPQVDLKNSLPIKEDSLTVDLHKEKCRNARVIPTKNSEKELSAFSKKWSIKTLAPIKFPNVNLNNKSSPPNSMMEKLYQLPIDNLAINNSEFNSENVDRQSKKKPHSWPFGSELSSEISAKDDFSKMPAKGTLRRKRWLLNNLKEKNGNYEDDIFENQNFDHYKPAFHFGDESDGSSVNIATPKFDCCLTPALPKKTPRFKDCISPTEFLQARKTAEEYLYRRNKKRKSGDKQSSSGKKTNVKKKSTVQDIPEKKKLDFEETVNKLIEVQKNLEIEAEVDDEEDDSYFSDTSN